ncbi:MAG: TatD DNase family protein [Parcubacteria bacterium C7867-004]|nr:MAG: TatD DNase family protein [Parcubacteria bacterium C7867-004]
MRYFDAHSHVQFPQYDEDRDAVLSAMRDAEIGALIVGTDSGYSKGAVDLADGKTLFAAVGLHPNDKPQEGYDPAYYEALAADSRVVAIGECGLDYFRPEDPEAEKERQKSVFQQHIELALRHDKPLMIHARPSKGTMDAYLDVIEMVKGTGVRGNMHFYVGDVETTKRFLELGFTFSFTAVLTFAREYDDVVKYLPIESILTETDAPYIAPASRRGQRNDPLAIPEIVAKIAEIRGEDEDTVREAVLANAIRVFAL